MECSKRKFASFTLAKKVAKAQAQRHSGDRFGAYHCSNCGSWHTGSNIGEPSSKRMAPYKRERVIL